MDWDHGGNWKQFKGKVNKHWGKLTDDQPDAIGGKRDQLAGRVQEVYGVSRAEAERQISDVEQRNAQRDTDAPSGVGRGRCTGGSSSLQEER